MLGKVTDNVILCEDLALKVYLFYNRASALKKCATRAEDAVEPSRHFRPK